MATKYLSLLLIFTAMISAGRAEQRVVVDKETPIPPQQSRQFEFGNLPQQDTTVLLEITARIQYRSLGGSSFFMKLALNGRPVEAARSRRVMRLVNKPLVSPVAPNLPSSWSGAGAGWRLLFAPDFEAARKQAFYVGDPYTTVLDVTDLVNPAAENRLEIFNNARPMANWTGDEGQLVLGRIVVHVKSEPSPTMGESSLVKPIINRGKPAAGPARYRGEVLPGGGFALSVGKRRWEVSSEFSYPDAGLNRLVPAGEPDKSGQPQWQPRVQPGEAGSVLAEGPHYRLSRQIRFTPRRVEIADTLTNKDSGKPLGMLVRHQVDLAGAADAAVRLAGNPDPAVNDYYSPPNPSVHIAWQDQSLGLICEDDVFRSQARLFFAADPPAAGLRTEMLRLGPGETYTMQWAVYPVAGPDYFDFINLVREDWGANFTVLGAWTFFHPDTILTTPIESIREHFQRLGIRYAIYCGGWVDPKHDRKRIGFGTGVLDDYWADFRGRLRRAAARIREASPETKVLVYYDSQRDTSEGGHERFRDSWLTGANGKQLSTEWGGVYSLTYSVVATLQNSYGKAMLAAVDRYMDELAIDGLYWDEMENVAYGAPLITYNIPDGHSCLLDPKTYTLQREIGLTTLLGETHRLAVIRRTRDQGGFVMGNGPATTLDMLQTGVQRMVEIQHNDSWCYEGNLGTPLGYMSSRRDFGNIVRALRMACLPVGTSYLYTHEISPYLFPFTPLELHHGYLLGKERIVAAHAGNFGWPGERCLVAVHHFDREGKRTGTDYPTTVSSEARTAIDPGEDEAVVLARLPVALEPAGGEAVVRQVRYDADKLSLVVSAPQGAVLRIADGPFAVRADRAYTAVIADRTLQPTVQDGCLQIEIPQGKQTVVRVSRS